MAYQPNFTTAEEAVKNINSGNRVFVHSVAAAPHHLLNAMVDRAGELEDVEVVQLHTEGEAPYVKAMKLANNSYWAVEVEVQRLGGAAWVSFAQGNRERALTLMRAAADLEATSEKAAVSPGRLVPARELLGDMLLESGRPGEALSEYEQSNSSDPNRYRTLYGAGQAAAQAGNHDKAQYYFYRLIELAGSGDPRPEMKQVRRYIANN